MYVKNYFQKINLMHWTAKLVWIIALQILSIVIVVILNQGKAHGLPAPRYCGDAGDANAYAGLVLNLQWWDAYGGLHEATGVGATVTTWGGTWSPPGNVLFLNGSTSESKASRYHQVNFGQVYRPDCNLGGAFGIWNLLGSDNTGVVLDYGTAWVLDCDTSKHWWPQAFHIVGTGVPAGARAGGWWDSEIIAPPNGQYKWTTLRYHEPPPPASPTVDLKINNSDTPSPITVGGSITASWTSANTTSCSASGQWSGGKPLNSSGEDRTPDSATSGFKNYVLTCNGPGGSASDTVQILVNPALTLPYLRVYGGDVLAGSGFGSTCTPTTTAKIITYNTGSGKGAGAQFGVQAFSSITEFASALGRTSTPQPDKGLTFANTGSGFGGNFGSGICAKDYFASATGASGSTTIPTTNVANGQHIVRYVNGNATITGNISYAGSGSWASPDEIPSYYLIVKGNIYIDKGVSRLDGVYIAQPNSSSPSTTGRIYTCTNGSATYPSTSTSIYADCNNKLTINGAFVAKQVKFLRTNGSLKNSTNAEPSTSAEIAESFIYSPELWLVNPGLTPIDQNPYDSINSLPPVL